MEIRMKCVDCGIVYRFVKADEVDADCECGGALRRMKRKPANSTKGSNPLLDAGERRPATKRRSEPPVAGKKPADNGRLQELLMKVTDRVVGIVCIAYGGVATIAWLIVSAIVLSVALTKSQISDVFWLLLLFTLFLVGAAGTMVAAGIGMLVESPWSGKLVEKSGKGTCVGSIMTAMLFVFIHVGWGRVGPQTNVFLLGIGYIAGGVLIGAIPALCSFWAHNRNATT